ncbi:Uncharacterised protein [Mycobacteroides abscessus subsp. abscessus]|nr:Uncharacterised protein [Mycobacteroides abscessus subsp. abscessus]
MRDAISDRGIAAQAVERKAFAEHVAEVQGHAAGQGLERQHAQQLGDARVGLQELPFADVELHGAAEGGHVDGIRHA